MKLHPSIRKLYEAALRAVGGSSRRKPVKKVRGTKAAGAKLTRVPVRRRAKVAKATGGFKWHRFNRGSGRPAYGTYSHDREGYTLAVGVCEPAGPGRYDWRLTDERTDRLVGEGYDLPLAKAKREVEAAICRRFRQASECRRRKA